MQNCKTKNKFYDPLKGNRGAIGEEAESCLVMDTKAKSHKSLLVSFAFLASRCFGTTIYEIMPFAAKVQQNVPSLCVCDDKKVQFQIGFLLARLLLEPIKVFLLVLLDCVSSLLLRFVTQNCNKVKDVELLSFARHGQ